MKKKVEDNFYDKVNYYEVKNEFTSVSNNIESNAKNFCEFGSLNANASSGVWKSINNFDKDDDINSTKNKKKDDLISKSDLKSYDISGVSGNIGNKLGCKKCGYGKKNILLILILNKF